MNLPLEVPFCPVSLCVYFAFFEISSLEANKRFEKLVYLRSHDFLVLGTLARFFVRLSHASHMHNGQ